MSEDTRMGLLIKIEQAGPKGETLQRALRAVTDALRCEFGDDLDSLLSHTPDPAHALLSHRSFADLEERMLGWTGAPDPVTSHDER